MTTGTNDPRCVNCRYFYSGNDNGLGWCRRHPPLPVCVATKEEPSPIVLGMAPQPPKITPLMQSFFPMVPEIGWCGDHQFGKGRLS